MRRASERAEAAASEAAASAAKELSSTKSESFSLASRLIDEEAAKR